MEFYTSKEKAQLLANNLAGLAARETEADHDPLPVIKLFLPGTGMTWLITELDDESGEDEIAFGLCDLGFGTPELGYVSLAELRDLKSRVGLRVEKDQGFKPEKPLSAYTAEASEKGMILA
ncbi:DUF2958 domain-containing protein [Acidocella sp.]|uniref:DUF2958 domain-containing protein n=1 Tax=Acidocella sp. TaxID=50710 RepID=UPI003CFC3065